MNTKQGVGAGGLNSHVAQIDVTYFREFHSVTVTITCADGCGVLTIERWPMPHALMLARTIEQIAAKQQAAEVLIDHMRALIDQMRAPLKVN